jgi:hypothetical protein
MLSDAPIRVRIASAKVVSSTTIDYKQTKKIKVLDLLPAVNRIDLAGANAPI